MKKTLICFCFLLLPFCLFASHLLIGPRVVFSSVNTGLYDKTAYSKAENYNGGLTAELSLSKKFALSEDININSSNPFNIKSESTTYITFKKEFAEIFRADFSLGFNLSLEKAVEGSDKIYLTSGGLTLDSFKNLHKNQIMDLLRILSLKASLGINCKDKVLIRLDYKPDIFPAFNYAPNGNIIDVISTGSIGLSLMFNVF